MNEADIRRAIRHSRIGTTRDRAGLDPATLRDRQWIPAGVTLPTLDVLCEHAARYVPRVDVRGYLRALDAAVNSL